jgi:hypothetical protein
MRDTVSISVQLQATTGCFCDRFPVASVNTGHTRPKTILPSVLLAKRDSIRSSDLILDCRILQFFNVASAGICALLPKARALQQN